MDDATFIKGELERIRHHMDIYKKTHEDFNKIQVEQTTILQEIKSAIRGSDMTNNKGMIHDFEEMKEQLQKQHDQQIKYDVYFKLFGASLILVFGGLITALVKIFTS